MKWILILFSTLAMKSCATSNTSNLQEKDTIVLTELNNTYHINTLNNKDVSAYKLVIEFNNETKQVSGFSGCNRFFGRYELEEEDLKFDAFGLTRMMCQGEVNGIENEFHKAIKKVNKITIEGDSISLLENNDALIVATKEAINNSITFEYSTSARGSYKSIKINDSGISISAKRSSKPVSKKYKKAHWNTLLDLVKNIDLEALSSLEPPSKDHQFDGAPLAHFKITKDNKTYEVASFDHGKPHPIIEPLVKEILSMSENIE